MAAGDQCMAAERYVQAKHQAFPDGTHIDSRDLPGYSPPTPLPGTADSRGKTLDAWERELSPLPGVAWPAQPS